LLGVFNADPGAAAKRAWTVQSTGALARTGASPEAAFANAVTGKINAPLALNALARVNLRPTLSQSTCERQHGGAGFPLAAASDTFPRSFAARLRRLRGKCAGVRRRIRP